MSETKSLREVYSFCSGAVKSVDTDDGSLRRSARLGSKLSPGEN